MSLYPFLELAEDLELAGLVWHPEIGDEVSRKNQKETVSILVDPQGMTPDELRSTFLWLPTVEQIVVQFESRQAILFHCGLELSSSNVCYKTVVQVSKRSIESQGQSMRLALGMALRDLLLTGKELIIN